MSNGEPSDYVAFAIAVSEEAGAVLKRARASGGLAVGRKSGFEIVTSADLDSDAVIRTAIEKAWPHHGIVSEESVRGGGLERPYCWIVDPLDGTANFAHGHDHVAVSIALCVKGRIELGVVHAPFNAQTFWAARGHGAYRNGERIAAATNRGVEQALVATGFPHDRTNIGPIVERLKPLLTTFGDIRRLSAPALDICWVADGRLDAFVDRVHLWDMAAADVIASEAGARTSGVSLEYQAPDGVDYFVAAPHLFEQLVRTIGIGA